MINQADTSQNKDVTNIFGSKSESNTYNVKELIDIQYVEKGQFSLYLSLLEYDSIYKKARFRVSATLDSEKTFT